MAAALWGPFTLMISTITRGRGWPSAGGLSPAGALAGSVGLDGNSVVVVGGIAGPGSAGSAGLAAKALAAGLAALSGCSWALSLSLSPGRAGVSKPVVGRAPLV